MAKKKLKKETLKQLSPQELAAYVPENPIPKIQEVIGLGLNSTYDLALQSGASPIGPVPNSSQTIPQVK